MANKFTRYLSDFGSGFMTGLTNPKGLVSNWQHATRLFIDDTMRLAPKHKFNYFVRFEIDKTAAKAPSFSDKHVEEIGLLVKTTDLPKFNFDTTTLNQYNRKKLIYTNFNYEPINLTLHDDANGVVNALWALYYGYYVRDRHISAEGFGATHYRKTGTPFDAYRYGLDNNISVPLFKSISIYTMGRRRFIGYTLVNPKITNWQHGNRDHADASSMAESSMSITYESVMYSAGTVSPGSPKGFANLHYDVTPSPLSVAGGGVSQLLGDGGVLDGLEQVFGAVGDGSAFSSPANFLSTVAKGINTYKNASNLTASGLIEEGMKVLSTPGATAQIAGGVTSVVGAVFPKSNTAAAATTATQKSVVSNVKWDDNLGDFI